MKKAVKTIFFALLACTFTAQAQTQKIGYLNAQAILADMTEMKSAESELEAFAKQLGAKDSVMVVTFQAKAQAIAAKQEKGELAPVQLEAEKKKLEEEQAKIQKFEQDMQQELAKKKQEKLQPIYDKVNKAITEVAKENGYTYVVDLTSGSLLYADEKKRFAKSCPQKIRLTRASCDNR